VAVAGCGGGSDVPRATPSPPAKHESPPAAKAVAWTHAAVLRHLEGRSIRVAGRKVRLDGATLTCGGVGRPQSRVRGVPAWTRFRCVQPTFPPGEVAGPDAIFFAAPTGPRTLAVTHAGLTSY
jgi:hypothetical protein